MLKQISRIVSKNKWVSLFLLIAMAFYLLLRVFQGLPYVKPYFQQIYYIVSTRGKVSYEEKMFKKMKLRYLYPKKIKEVTPENAIICFWDNDALLDHKVAAYFLYPRITKEIFNKGQLALDQVNSKGCNYLIINRNLPNFNMTIARVILFDDKYGSNPTVINTNKYIHSEAIYVDRVGIIQI